MKACLPDGLRMVFEQKAGADNTASETTAGGSDSPKGTVTAPTGGTSATTNATTNTNTNTTTSTGSGTVAKESKSQDSCSLGGGGGAWAALLASLALVAFRRKRARDR